MNNNYIKGRNKEYQCMKILSKQGCLVFRMAGSHSPFDVIAFLKKDNTEQPLIRAIQCKAKQYIGKKEIRKLEKLSLPSVIQKEMWYFRPRQEPIIEIIR